MFTYHGTIEKSRTWSINVQWLMSKIPVDLTGYDLFFRAKLSNDQSWNYSTSITTGGITITDLLNGKFTIEISRQDTAELPLRELLFLVEAISPSDRSYTVFTGTLDVIQAMRAN